jgi:rhamnosyltransferase subunit B
MRVILASVGTVGDTLPFLAVGREFLRRGHEVVFLGNGAHRSIVERDGVEFVELISATESERQALSRRRWHRGLIAMREGFANLITDVPTTFRAIAERLDPGRTIVLAPGIMFGARIAQEKLGVPLATMHLQPACFRSEGDPIRWLPKAAIRLGYRMTDAIVDYYLRKPLNRFRGELGLPPTRFFMRDWWNSPDLTIGAFPSFIAPTDTPWPEQFFFSGFASYHPSDAFGEEDRLQAFLERHPRPIVFSPTSAVSDSRTFLNQAATAMRLQGRPAVILAPGLERVPDSLPPNIAHFRYVPHDRLLPAAAALVHNGGIGTSAAAMTAGIPQLVVPLMLDQPDNARRLKRLGVAAVVARRSYRPDRAARELNTLLESPLVAERCAHFAAECRRENGVERIVDRVERLVA